jgi:hypothetical protein
MAEPGTYERAVELFDEYPDSTRTRLLRDSDGNWHGLKQLVYVMDRFDELVGLDTGGDKFNPDFEKGRQILDEAIRESKRTGFSIDMCFQLVVQKLHGEALDAQVEAELNAKKKQP